MFLKIFEGFGTVFLIKSNCDIILWKTDKCIFKNNFPHLSPLFADDAKISILPQFLPICHKKGVKMEDKKK